MSNTFKKNDYVFYTYDGEELISRITNVKDNIATLEICLSARRGEQTLTDVIDVNVSEIRKIN